MLCLTASRADCAKDGSDYHSTREKDTGIIAEHLEIIEHLNGRKVVTGSIKELRSRKKKIGFVAVGLFKMLEGKDVTLNIYSDKETARMVQTPLERLPFDIFRQSGSFKKENLGLANITINFFLDNTRVSSLHAAYATAETQTGNIVFTGNASLSGPKGRINCAKLLWNQNSGLFTTTEKFFFHTNGHTSTGTGFKTDYRLENISWELGQH